MPPEETGIFSLFKSARDGVTFPRETFLLWQKIIGW
jgi:hypothetical protein